MNNFQFALKRDFVKLKDLKQLKPLKHCKIAYKIATIALKFIYFKEGMVIPDLTCIALYFMGHKDTSVCNRPRSGISTS